MRLPPTASDWLHGYPPGATRALDAQGLFGRHGLLNLLNLQTQPAGDDADVHVAADPLHLVGLANNGVDHLRPSGARLVDIEPQFFEHLAHQQATKLLLVDEAGHWLRTVTGGAA